MKASALKTFIRCKSTLFSALAVLILGFFIAGCYDSIHPISTPQSGALDERILGTWYLQKKGNADFIHIGKTSRPDMIFIILIENADAQGVKYEKYIAHGSKIGDAAYLNIHQHDEETDTATYLFIKYRIDKDVFKYSLTDTAVLEADIKKGKLPGEMFDGHPFITADSQEIVRYLQANDSRLFHEILTAKRIKLPDTEDNEGAAEKEKPKDESRQ